MNAEWLRARGVVAAAVGAGILLGAAGILLYQQIVAEKKRLDRVASSVSLLRREIDHLKRCQSTFCLECMQKLACKSICFIFSTCLLPTLPDECFLFLTLHILHFGKCTAQLLDHDCS